MKRRVLPVLGLPVFPVTRSTCGEDGLRVGPAHEYKEVRFYLPFVLGVSYLVCKDVFYLD